MRDSVPSGSYSSVCNVLRQWNIPLIPTYRVYRLYDKRQWCSTTPRCMDLLKLASRLDLAMVLLRLMSSLSSQWQEAMTVDGGSTYVRTHVGTTRCEP